MTQVARVFVVLNLLLAAGFLFSAATILSLNQDWKQKYEAEAEAHTQTRLTKDRQITAVTGERDDFRRANDQLREENSALKTSNSNYTTSNERLIGENAAKDTALSEQRQSLDNLQAAVNRQETHIRDLEGENKKNADDARKARDEAKAARGELKMEREKTTDLTNRTEELAKDVTARDERIKELEVMTAFAKSHGINFENLVVMDPVRGAVVNADNETRLAVINVGSKQGVKRGYVLDVTRGSNYIARIEVETVYDNAAAGTIKFLTPGEVIRAGDSVTNELN